MKTLQSAYRKIKYIYSKPEERVHPVDVFLEWLAEKMKMLLYAMIIFLIGVGVGLMM